MDQVADKAPQPDIPDAAEAPEKHPVPEQVSAPATGETQEEVSREGSPAATDTAGTAGTTPSPSPDPPTIQDLPSRLVDSIQAIETSLTELSSSFDLLVQEVPRSQKASATEAVRESLGTAQQMYAAAERHVPRLEAILDRIVDRSTATTMVNDIAKSAAALDTRYRAYWADVAERTRLARKTPRRLLIAGASVAAPCLLLLGVLVQFVFEPVTPHDATAGWRDWIWNNYGRRIEQCVTQAEQSGKNINCGIVARPPSAAK